MLSLIGPYSCLLFKMFNANDDWGLLCFMYLTLRVEHRLRVFENRVLRRIFGPKRDRVTGEWKKYIMWSLMICSLHPILCG